MCHIHKTQFSCSHIEKNTNCSTTKLRADLHKNGLERYVIIMRVGGSWNDRGWGGYSQASLLSKLLIAIPNA